MADFSINAELKANASQFVSELKKGETSVNNFGGIIDKVLGPKGKLIMALTAATTAAVKFGQAMNASMSEIAKGTGATGEQLIKLRDNAHDALVNGVARSAKEVGTMIADLNTRFGVTGKELTVLTKEFSDFADVTGVDTKSAINTTADVMAKWNIQTEDANKLLDQLTKASQDSGAGVDELLAGLKQGQAVFSQFGMSASDSIAYMASLKANGIETSKALTGMQIALAKFSQQGIEAQAGFEAVSKAIKNASTDTEALNIAVETFGTRNGAEMVKILRDSADSADKFKEAIMNAGGAVEATKEASRTSADAFKELKSALSGTFGGFGEGFDELFKGIIDGVTNLVRTISPIIKPIANIFRDLLSTIGGLVTEVTSRIQELTNNNTGFQSLATTLDDVYNIIHQTLGFILDSFKTAFGFIFAIINGKWDLAWEYLKKTLLVSAKFVLDTISGLLNTVKDNINVFIEKVINPFVDKLNWVQEKLGFEKTEKFGLIENFDLSKMAGVTDTLEKVNKKIEKLSGKTAAKITGDLGQVQKATKDAGKEAENQAEKTEEALEEIPKWLQKITKGYEKLTDNTEAFGQVATNTLATAAEVGSQTFGDMFSMLGEELVAGEASFQNYAATAVEGIAKVLTSLGSELLALSVARAANYDYATAAIAAAGAAAAFVASGVASGVASALKKQAEATVEAAEGFEDYLEKIKEISAETSSFEDIFVNVSDIQSTYDETLKTMNERLAEQNNQLAAAQNELNGLNIAVGSLAASGLLLSASITAAFAEAKRKEIEQIRQEIDATNHEIEALKKSADDLINEELKKATANALSNLKAVNAELQNTINNYQKYVYSGLYSAYTEVLSEQLKSNVLGAVQSIYSDLQSVGVSLGSMFIDNFVDGATSSDFFTSIKDYMRENIIKLTVYSESFIEKISAQSTSLLQAMTIGDYDKIAEIKSSLKSLYEEQATAVAMIDSALDDIFSDVIEVTDEAVSYVTDSVEDMGESISDTLISSLENGLDNGEFLDSMKKYIRKMVIQTVVYTENLQSQIEAIGKAISDGIASGFSESGLDALRMDFSYLYYQAENSMSKIDSVLDAVFSGYATGTQNATAGLHLVGEAGPELVRFNGGEQVYNASDTRKMLSGGNVGGNNFNVTFNNLQDTTAYTMLQQLKQYNREMAINGIM